MAKYLKNDPTNLDEKHELLTMVESMFTSHAENTASEYVRINTRGPDFGKLDPNKINLCCDKDTRLEIIDFGELIKSVQEFNDLKLVEIYVALVYVYYALRYSEPNNAEWLYSKKFFNNLEGLLNIKEIKVLIKHIGGILDDIIIIDKDGKTINLSSKIRKKALELRGGNANTKHYKKRTRRRNKRAKNTKKTKTSRTSHLKK